MKSTYTSVISSKEQNERIGFELDKDNMIHIQLGSSDVAFTKKETKEIVEILKKLVKNNR